MMVYFLLSRVASGFLAISQANLYSMFFSFARALDFVCRASLVFANPGDDEETISEQYEAGSESLVVFN